VAGTDAGALNDPVVRSLDAFLRQFGGQVGIGQALERQEAACAQDAGISADVGVVAAADAA